MRAEGPTTSRDAEVNDSHGRYPLRFVEIWREALVLALVLIIGVADLTAPTLGDQALYLTYANKMAAGGILYHDVWDIKQPGIFFFYLIAVKLFGSNDVSPHVLELLWMLALAVALQIALRPYFSHRWTKALVALPTVALYYAVSSPFLAQVEGLIALPLFVTLWGMNAAARGSHVRAYAFVFAGISAGVVLCFKLVYIVVVAAMYLATAVYIADLGGEHKRKATIGFSLVAFALGAMIPLCVATIVVVNGAGFDTVYQTTFVYPGRILREHPGAPASRLLQSAGYFLKIFAPIVILAAIGGFAAFRRRDPFLTRLLSAWLVSGLVGIIVQTWSWWEHHFLLLWIPVGIFATKTIDVALDWAARETNSPKRVVRRTLVTAGLLSLFVPAAAQPATNVYLMLHTQATPWTEVGRRRFQVRRSALYRDIFGTTAFLRDSASQQGPIFVCGSPVTYVLARRDQALRADGYSLDLQLPEQWAEFGQEFDAKRPVFVYIEQQCRPLLEQHAPASLQTLRTAYRVRQHSVGGVWYERSR